VTRRKEGEEIKKLQPAPMRSIMGKRTRGGCCYGRKPPHPNCPIVGLEQQRVEKEGDRAVGEELAGRNEGIRSGGKGPLCLIIHGGFMKGNA